MDLVQVSKVPVPHPASHGGLAFSMGPVAATLELRALAGSSCHLCKSHMLLTSVISWDSVKPLVPPCLKDYF